MTWTPSDQGEGGGGAAIGVVIPAAGSGQRMGGRKKAFLELEGVPLVIRTLEPFLAHPRVEAVAVVLPPEEAEAPPAYLVGVDPRVRLVAGGATRQASVHAGVAALPAGLEVILVHDGARPLVTREIIDRCVEVAAAGEGAVASWPAVDTLQEVDAEERVVATPDRSRFRVAQTPQAFPAAPFRAALERARAEGFQGTDDASVHSWAGGTVRMVPGARWNLKVTEPEDLVVARALLGRAGEGEGVPEGRGTRQGGPQLSLLFVCTGNTCRSPMAEALARREAERRGWTGFQVQSAGVAAPEGTRASGGAVRAGAARGLELGSHRARLLTAELVERADLILALSPGHLPAIEALGGGGRAALLPAFAAGARPGDDEARGGPGIPDPFGGSDSRYLETLDILEALVREAMDRLGEAP